MRKIVINRVHGGFGLVDSVKEEYNRIKKTELEWDHEFPRDDPVLIEIIERIGLDKSADRYAELKIVEIPDDVEWTIDEYDGLEWVAEKHRTWR